MRAFVKTLVGDVWNVSVVAGILLAAGVAVGTAHADVAPFLLPPLTLAGVVWLANRPGWRGHGG